MNQRDIHRILQKYGLSASKIQPYDSHYVKGVVYRVGTSEGDVAVKPFRGSRRRLSAIYTSVNHLRKLGFCHMPRWYHTTVGRPWVISQGQAVYVSEWIDGPQFGKRAEDYALLGDALGSLHGRTSMLRTTRRMQAAQKKLQADHQHCVALLRNLNSQNVGKLLGTWYEKTLDQILELSEFGWSELMTLVQQSGALLRLSFIHGDVTVPNVMLQDNKAILIDFEQLRHGFSTIELSKALANTTGFNTNHMSEFMTSYEQQIFMTPEERQLLLASFTIPREFYTSIEQAQKYGGTPQIADIFRNSWSRRLEAIAWLKNWCQMSQSRDQGHSERPTDINS